MAVRTSLPMDNLNQTLASSGPAYLQRKVVNLYKKGSPFFAMVHEKNKIQQPRKVGRTLILPLAVGNNKTFRARSTRTPIPVREQDYIRTAEFPWSSHTGSVTFFEEDVHDNMDDAQIIDIVQTALDVTAVTIVEYMNRQLVRGISHPTNRFEILGLTDAVAAGGVDGQTAVRPLTYGGIAHDDADYINYRGLVRNSSGYANLVPDLRRTFNNATWGAEKPNLIMTDEVGFDIYEGKMTGDIRHTDLKIGDVTFQSLQFRGTPVVFDRDVGPPTWWDIDEEDVETESVSLGTDTLVTGAQDTGAAIAGASTTHRYWLLNTDTFRWVFDPKWTIENAIQRDARVPYDQLSWVRLVVIRSQFVCLDRRKNAVLRNVPES